MALVEPGAESSKRGLWEGSQMSFPQEERGCQASAGVYVETIWDVIRALVWSPHPWHEDEEGRSVTTSLRKPVTWKEPGRQSVSSSLAQRRCSVEHRHLPVPHKIHQFWGQTHQTCRFSNTWRKAWRRKELSAFTIAKLTLSCCIYKLCL